MLTTFILGSNPATVDYFHRCCLEIKDIVIPHVLDAQPPLHQLMRILNTHSPQIVFLEIDPAGLAYQAAVDIAVAAPDSKIVGFAAELPPDVAAEAAEFGIRDILRAPYEPQSVFLAVQRVIKAPKSERCPIVAFQPALGGSGATTTALNVAHELAHQYDRKVLLIDTDLRSGPLPFWFDVDPDPSIIEALESCHSLNEQSWKQMVWDERGFDMVLSPRRRRPADETYSSWDFLRMVGFAAQRYDAILVDLPEVVIEEFGVIRERADFKFVVCTPDPVSGAMARRRIEEMEGGGAELKNVALILNMVGRGSLSKGQLEKLVRRPVALELPDDKTACEPAFLDALTRKASRLVKGYRRLAEAIDRQAPPPRPSGISGAASALVRAVSSSIR